MSRPESITDEDIDRWSKIIEQDNQLYPQVSASPIIREVCYAGLWLSEELKKVECPEPLIVRIRWTAGALSFGRDIWKVHQEILQKYQDNELVFEEDPDEIKN